ncbi:MAG: ATPase [Firmicutes bacterium]|nr:ATPase [Bacillota bacterium]
MESFYLESYLEQKSMPQAPPRIRFPDLCKKIRDAFLEQWSEDHEDLQGALQLQKKAIMGYDNEVAYFKDRIREFLKREQAEDVDYPEWYADLTEAIFHENWGLAGLAQWFGEEYKNSSSAKVIGDRIYFLHKGKMHLMPQQISKERREQMIRAFLLSTPEERLDRDFHEVYLIDGTRITIFGGQMTKPGQDVIIFRRYVVPTYSFEEQALRGTIPREAIPLFRAMVGLGYNVAFTGAVRTAKTTFLSTWQSYEDKSLEGVLVETDPEIPLHSLLPEAPIVQILADNEKLRKVSKNLLRSDADYFILAEARDGNALETALQIASKGTRRMKITFHERDPKRFPWDVAWEIARDRGGDIALTAKRAALSFDYVFHFIQLKNKNEKRLSSIYEMGLDKDTDQIRMQKICTYLPQDNCWKWTYFISEEKMRAGVEEDPETFRQFASILEELANGSQRKD